LVALKLSYMAHPWPLMIQTIKRSIGTAFFGTRSLVISQGTDSTGFAVKNMAGTSAPGCLPFGSLLTTAHRQSVTGSPAKSR